MISIYSLFFLLCFKYSYVYPELHMYFICLVFRIIQFLFYQNLDLFTSKHVKEHKDISGKMAVRIVTFHVLAVKVEMKYWYHFL